MIICHIVLKFYYRRIRVTLSGVSLLFAYLYITLQRMRFICILTIQPLGQFRFEACTVSSLLSLNQQMHIWFQITDLLINITKHVLKPHHEALTAAEKEKLLKKYNIQESQVRVLIEQKKRSKLMF